MLLALLGLCLDRAEARGPEHLIAVSGFTAKTVEGKKFAPDFRLPDLEGRERGLDEFRGKTILLHFWASWCEPCKAEFPALVRLSERLGERLAVIGIAQDSIERALPFAKSHGARFPILIDRFGSSMRAYNVKLIPVSILIGEDGTIQAAFIGPQAYDSVEAIEFFEKILK